MQITVTANEFCPDNCPFCDIENKTMYNIDGNVAYTEYICRNAAICRQGAEMAKRRLNND